MAEVPRLFHVDIGEIRQPGFTPLLASTAACEAYEVSVIPRDGLDPDDVASMVMATKLNRAQRRAARRQR